MAAFRDITSRLNGQKILDTWFNLLRTAGITAEESFANHANDAAFVTQKGSAATDGDKYYNTTDDVVRLFEDGVWVSFQTGSSNAKYNHIINGDFDFWQDTSSFAAVANDTRVADMFVYNKGTTTAVHTVSRDTDLPTAAQSGHDSTYSMKTDCTTADAAVAALDLVYLNYRMEGYDLTKFLGKKINLSFWVKGTKTGIHSVAFKNNVSDRYYIVEYTINTTLTWEYKTIPITMDTTATGAWLLTSGIGLRILWVLMAGSTQQATTDVWATGDKYASANQVNACDNIANDFWLSQVVLNDGETAIPFVRNGRTIQEEFNTVRRYIRKSYNHDTDPGTIANIGRIKHDSNGSNNADHSIVKHNPFNPPMRIAPTVTIYGSVAGTIDRIDMANGERTHTAPNVGETGFDVAATNGAASTARLFQYYYLADSRL